MTRPTQLLKELSLNARKDGAVMVDNSDMYRIMRYVTYLEDRVESAEAYAAKHADMYIEEQNRRAKEERSQ